MPHPSCQWVLLEHDSFLCPRPRCGCNFGRDNGANCIVFRWYFDRVDGHGVSVPKSPGETTIPKNGAPKRRSGGHPRFL